VILRGFAVCVGLTRSHPETGKRPRFVSLNRALPENKTEHARADQQGRELESKDNILSADVACVPLLLLCSILQPRLGHVTTFCEQAIPISVGQPRNDAAIRQALMAKAIRHFGERGTAAISPATEDARVGLLQPDRMTKC
jgi:hypothetical protein